MPARGNRITDRKPNVSMPICRRVGEDVQEYPSSFSEIRDRELSYILLIVQCIIL